MKTDIPDRVVDQDSGRRMRVQHRSPAQLCQHRLPRWREILSRPRGDPPRFGRPAWFTRPRSPDMPVNPLRFRDHFESSVDFTGRFRTAKQQNATLTQREMEQRDDPRLRVGPQIDQQIAARNQVDARKWRIGQHVLHGENDQSPQLRHYFITVPVFREETSQAFGRHVAFNRIRVRAFPCLGDGIRVYVGCKHLQFNAAACCR